MSDYSVEVCKALEKKFLDTRLHRPMRINRYDKGTKLVYKMTPVGAPDNTASHVHLIIEKFVGGGFAGQVYRVRIIKIEGHTIAGLEEQKTYAMKILIPPSSGALMFRNMVYAVGFQGPFQLQTNPDAAMAGALWQKFIRRGAKICFGDKSVVNNIHTVFVDENLGSCGELSDWVEGRTWMLEVDEYMDVLSKWKKRGGVDGISPGSPEYRAKKEFMADFVKLLHEMGGHEFARQYEWSTCKSQPNCLKRLTSGTDPSAGLTAVDFRAGLALLPFLPMSPGDFKLIGSGLLRGSLVQFDRGDTGKLEKFMSWHSHEFQDMTEALIQLKECEEKYRSSIPDITHNHVKLLYKGSLWKTILEKAATGWRVRNFIDQGFEQKLHSRKTASLVLLLLCIIPFLGKFILKLFGNKKYRTHYANILTSFQYLKRTLRGRSAEKLIMWHRAERLSAKDAIRASESTCLFTIHFIMSILPPGLHRFITNIDYAKQKLSHLIIRPVRLYFDSDLREQWLRDMVEDGKKKRLLNEDDAEIILSKIKEPFIQKYLKSLAVHVCTLPVTQVVSVAIAIIYVLIHPEMPRSQSWAVGLGIIALFQVIPVSPGSLCRGLYVVYLVIKERNFKDYNIAVFLGFFKYIGYLAFPIQMAYRYPALARFMASHWATEAVHVVPVFGESGALLEHSVFCMFYNWPLTIRRRIRERTERLSLKKPRYWHTTALALAGGLIFTAANVIYIKINGHIPELKDIWWLAAIVPFVSGTAVTIWCAGAPLSKRIIASAVCGLVMAIIYSTAAVFSGTAETLHAVTILSSCLWQIFIFTVFSVAGAMITELKLP